MTKISIANLSTSFKDSDLPALANALQIQLHRDFAPSWGVGAQLYWNPTGVHPPADHWVLGLFDTSDQPGALGYHDVTPTGQPLGKVFVQTTLSDGMLPSVTTSHELLEMLADPDINLTAELDDASGRPSKFFAYEVGDPVEADVDGYDIVVPTGWPGGGTTVRVSDFTLPAWFESFNTVGPWDHMGHLKAPFTLNPGGYIGFLDLANLGAGWQQLTARETSPKVRAASRPHPGSRRSRRRLPRSEWLRSTYEPGTEEPIPAQAPIV